MGYGVVECHGAARVAYVECGVITASARAARPERLCEIGRGLRELMAELRPDAVAMEEAFFGKNVQATLALGEARGVALFVAAEQGLVGHRLSAGDGEASRRRSRARDQGAGRLPGARAAGDAAAARGRRRRRAGDRDLPRAQRRAAARRAARRRSIAEVAAASQRGAAR